MTEPTVFAQAARAYHSWISELTRAESCVAGFVLDRVHRYGLDKRAISISEFLEGIWDSGDRPLTKPVGVSKRHLHRALNSLVEKGYLIVEGSQYNRSARIYSLNLIVENSPKCAKSWHSSVTGMALVDDTDGTREGHGWHSSPHDHTRERISKGDIKVILKNSPTVPAGNVLGNILNSIVEKTQVVKETKLATGGILALQRFWFDQCKDYYPDRSFSNFTVPERVNFTRLVRQRLDNANPKEFISFVISHWVEIMCSKFASFPGGGPGAPEFMFVYNMLGRFTDAFGTHKAGGTLVARDRARKVEPLFQKIDGLEDENTKLQRRVGASERAAQAAEWELKKVRAELFRARNPGLTAEQAFDAEVRKSRAKNVIRVSPKQPMRAIIADIKAYTPPEF
jgi:hypothetical protein